MFFANQWSDKMGENGYLIDQTMKICQKQFFWQWGNSYENNKAKEADYDKCEVWKCR